MSHSKKIIHSWRYGFFNLVLGLMFSVYPLFILRSFLNAFCYVLLTCTLSCFNINIINKRQFLFSFPSSLIGSDEAKSDRYSLKKVERKESSVFISTALFLPSVFLYYMICVFFGAPVFESYTSTLYFSCLMTLLTVYPLIWHFYMTDNISSVFRIIQDNKFDNTNESHLHVLIIWSIIGAWLGAIPIPLDWDRPWQEWPITCCIGAALGSSAAHFFIGSKVLLNLFREKKKVLLKSV